MASSAVTYRKSTRISPNKESWAPMISVVIKMLSGDLIPLEIPVDTTQLQFYKIVNDRYSSYHLAELLLYRMSEIEDNLILVQTDHPLQPQEGDVFCLFIEPFPFSIYSTTECVASDRNQTYYFIAEITIDGDDESKSSLYEERLLIRTPQHQGDLFIPEIYHMKDIQIIRTEYREYGCIKFDIENPTYNLAFSDITLLVRSFISQNEYFSIHTDARTHLMYQRLIKEWDELMNTHTDFDTQHHLDDENENENEEDENYWNHQYELARTRDALGQFDPTEEL